MSLSKLSIFSKDTDASEIIKGYEYQKLRTLENWLEIYFEANDQIIYCDYEEDIFRRDLSTWASEFRQLKLYSSKNFSLTSIEITKAISHFFIIFCRADYALDKISFVFETNVSVAGKYKDNDAELLEEWKLNQESISDALLSRCSTKIKEVIKGYIEPFGKKEKDDILIEQFNEAKLLVDEIPDSVWNDFAKSIRWNFGETSADETIKGCIDRI